FGAIPRPDRRMHPEYTVEPVQDGERQVVLRRHGGTPLIATMYHIPAAGSPHFAALDLGGTILSDTPSGRLYHELVGKNRASSVFGFAADMNQPGYAFFAAQLEPGMDQEKALATLKKTVESTDSKPFSQEDLDRVRNKWLTDWAQVYASPPRLASALSEATADGDWRLFFLQHAQVEGMTLEQVQQATSAYLVSSNRTSGKYIPTEKPVRAPLPEAPDLNTLLKDFKGRDAGPDIAAFDTTPANIDASTLRSPLDLP